jgi:hypothetical protein
MPSIAAIAGAATRVRNNLPPAVVLRLRRTWASRCFGCGHADRRGGYTRILQIGTRRGDAAPVAILELVDRPEAPKEKADKGKGKKAAEPKGKEAKKARKAAAAAGRG